MKTKQEQKDEAWKVYIAIQAPALKAHEAIIDPAWEAYLAKCDEIDASEVVEKT